MFGPEFFEPLIKLICQRKTALRKTGLTFFALYMRACACAHAAHMCMTRSPNIIITKGKEILIWDNRNWSRIGAEFFDGMELTHG